MMPDARGSHTPLSTSAVREPSLKREQDNDFVEELTRELEAEVRDYRRRRFFRFVRRLVRTAIILGIVFAVIGQNWGPFVWFMIVLGGTEAADRKAARRRHVARLLRRTRDPRAVNVLALAVLSRDPATQAVARQALEEILPTLKASDARYITPEGFKALTGLLRLDHIRDYRLVMATLEALKQVGTPACIPAVERLRRTPPAVRLMLYITDSLHYLKPRLKIEEIRKSAEECLEILRMREKHERDRATLLRPADRPPDDMLLRPVQTSRPQDDITLVRPVEGDASIDNARHAADEEIRAVLHRDGEQHALRNGGPREGEQ